MGIFYTKWPYFWCLCFVYYNLVFVCACPHGVKCHIKIPSRIVVILMKGLSWRFKQFWSWCDENNAGKMLAKLITFMRHYNLRSALCRSLLHQYKFNLAPKSFPGRGNQSDALTCGLRLCIPNGWGFQRQDDAVPLKVSGNLIVQRRVSGHLFQFWKTKSVAIVHEDPQPDIWGRQRQSY